MWVKPDRRIFSHSFQPAVSPKALTRISREIRSWVLITAKMRKFSTAALQKRADERAADAVAVSDFDDRR